MAAPASAITAADRCTTGAVCAVRGQRNTVSTQSAPMTRGGVGEGPRRPDGLVLVVTDHEGQHLVASDLRGVVELPHIRAGSV
jgi:hypothetical protein